MSLADPGRREAAGHSDSVTVHAGPQSKDRGVTCADEDRAVTCSYFRQALTDQCGWIGGSKDMVFVGAPLASLVG